MTRSAGRHLRGGGRIFPEFTVSIPKNRELLATKRSVDAKKLGLRIASRCATKAIRGLQKKLRPFLKIF